MEIIRYVNEYHLKKFLKGEISIRTFMGRSNADISDQVNHAKKYLQPIIPIKIIIPEKEDNET